MNSHKRNQTIRTPHYKKTSVTRDVGWIEPTKRAGYAFQGLAVVAGKQVTVATVDGKFWVIVDAKIRNRSGRAPLPSNSEIECIATSGD